MMGIGLSNCLTSLLPVVDIIRTRILGENEVFVVDLGVVGDFIGRYPIEIIN